MISTPSEDSIRWLRRYGELQPSERFFYVTIHPLADDSDHLARLGIDQEACIVCDLYWIYGKRRFFVSILADAMSEAFVTMHDKVGGEVNLAFHVVLSARLLTSGHVERVLQWLEEWLTKGEDVQLRDGKARIANKDIAL